MANIPETPTFSPDVYQIETTDKVFGRMTGLATRHPVVTPQSLPNTGGIFFGNPHRLRPRGGRSSGKGAVAPHGLGWWRSCMG